MPCTTCHSIASQQFKYQLPILGEIQTVPIALTCSSRDWNVNPTVPLIDDGRHNIFAGDDRLTNLSRRR